MTVLWLSLASALVAIGSAGSPWGPDATQRAQTLLNQMSLTQKLYILHGYKGGYVGNVPAQGGLPIPPLNLEDGPQGVADGVNQVTCWPSAMTVVATWDPDAMYEFGMAMGQEQYIKGTNVMLGPGVNLARVPWGGRTFEYQGEDPVLAAKMVAAEVIGIQSQNVSGCVKHYVDNNQEYNRGSVSENVPQRAQWELYYQAFAAAVDAGVGSAMCSYNRINNTYACENAVTLGDLKGPMGFRGWVMSDWGATHSTIPAANNGLDQQMPDDTFFGSALAAAVAAGNVTVDRINDMVMRILTPAYAIGLMDNPPTGNLNADALSPAHNTLARTLAERSTVLLKNDKGVLPLVNGTLKKIAVLGDQNSVHGGGSGGVNTPYIITPWAGITNYVNGGTPVRPVNCTYVNNTDFYQPGNPCTNAASLEGCCTVCSGMDGCNAFTYVAGSVCSDADTKHNRGIPAGKPTAAGGQCWLKPDDSGRTNHTGMVSGNCAPYPPTNGTVNVTYMSGSDSQAAAALAAACDVAIVVVAVTSSEGSDRGNLSLPWWQDALVEAVIAAQPRTIVVARCPGACLMPWAGSVSAIVYQAMPGQEAGNALANVLFGAVNPSGRLPVSFPGSMTDTWLGNPVNPAQYPGTQRTHSWLEADYSENLLMGYRWYDAMNISPLWPFGHGLSYTTFTYSNLAVSGSVSSSSNATITLNLANTGGVAGAEVVQLYVGFPDAADEPPKVLRDFQKIPLDAGAQAAVQFTLTYKQVQIWSVITQGWQVVPGTYNVMIGSSSRDIRQTGTVQVTN